MRGGMKMLLLSIKLFIKNIIFGFLSTCFSEMSSSRPKMAEDVVPHMT